MPKLARLVLYKKIVHAAVIIAGVGLLLFGAIGLLQRYQATHAAVPLPPSGQVITNSTKQPDETPIKPGSKQGNAYTTAADEPRLIRLPTIGAEGFIQKVGIDQKAAVGVPTNISLAGWYALGAKPGDTGISLIDGHVQGKYNPGIFKNLAKLQAGDKFTIEFGDTSSRSFQVVGVKSYSVAEAGKQMLLQQKDISKQLNLITCGGRYISAAQQYENRILVVAKRTD